MLNGVTAVPGYTYIEDRTAFGSGLNFPTFTFGMNGTNGILLADVSAGSTSPVPEPTSLLLLSAGLLGARWRARRPWQS